MNLLVVKLLPEKTMNMKNMMIIMIKLMIMLLPEKDMMMMIMMVNMTSMIHLKITECNFQKLLGSK